MGEKRDDNPAEFGVIKRHIRATGDVTDVILVWEGASIPEVTGFCYVNRGLKNEPVLSLARDGIIRFAVEDVRAVPERWRPFAVALDDLDDREPCRWSVEPPNCYVWRAGGGPGREVRRDGNTPGLWPEPAEGYRGFASPAYGWVEVGDSWVSQRELERDAELMTSYAEKPERERDRICRGRLVVCRTVHNDQPPGEGLAWELRFRQGERETCLYHSSACTHDLKRIREEILANREEILSRMGRLARRPTHEQQVPPRGIERGV